MVVSKHKKDTVSVQILIEDIDFDLSCYVSLGLLPHCNEECLCLDQK